MAIEQESSDSSLDHQKLSLGPMGDACSRADLVAIHTILEKNGYKDDEGVTNDVCMSENQMEQ